MQACCAGSCCGIGILLLIAGPMVFGGLRQALIEDVLDFMFIDNTIETEEGNFLGGMVAEKEQFDAWKRPMKEDFQKCAKENSAVDCVNGLDVDIAVFNVTNPSDVVNGAKPIVQELGPIFLKMYNDKINVETEQWNKEGVAKFQQDTTFEIDEARCNQACQDLLKAKVIVPNPAFNTIAALGAEMVFASIVAVAGTAQMLPEGVGLGAAFGITDADESAAFKQVFLTEPDQNKKMASVGAFLATGQAAVAGLQKNPPDTSGTCILGTLQVPAITCATVLKKLMESLPATWAGTMAMLAPLYGTGAAAPVFMQVTVAEALGFETSFTDPLTGRSDLHFAALNSHGSPASDREGVFREAQMAKKFADKGTSYQIRYGGLAHDCRFDRDCTLSTPAPDSCTVSEACTPTEMHGYYGIAVPGRLWDEPGGFDILKSGSQLRIFKSGLIVSTVFSDEKSLKLKEGDHAGAELKYFEQSLLGVHERNENCGGDLPGSPGFDCDGPRHTATLSMIQGGAPLYLSTPFFDNTQRFANDPSQQSLKFGPKSYNPADKVVIEQCKDNTWCDKKDYTTYLRHESATGFAFEAQSCLQLNLRIGSVPSMLFPKMADSTIPVWWRAEKILLPPKVLGDLYKLQAAPSELEGVMILVMIIGVFCLLIGLQCFGLVLYRRKRQQATIVKEVETK